MNTPFPCPECGQMTVTSFTDMSYEVQGMRVTIKAVPAQLCPNGHSFVDGFTAENVNRLVNHIVEDVSAYSKKLVRPFQPLREIVVAV